MFISHRLRLVGLMQFVVIALSCFSYNVPITLGSEVSDETTYTKEDLLVEVNEIRTGTGQVAFSVEANIENAAKLKGRYMELKGYFNHWSPDRSVSPWNFLDLAGYKYTLAGENLAMCYGSATQVVEAMMASPLHRDNLLNAEYQDIGIEVYSAPYEDSVCSMVVMYFGTEQKYTR